MRHHCGVAPFAGRFTSTTKHTIVAGVWLPWAVSPVQETQMKEFNGIVRPGGGRVAVHISDFDTTSIVFFGQVNTAHEARAIAVRLVRIVAAATGAHAMLQRMPNQACVRKALY